MLLPIRRRMFFFKSHGKSVWSTTYYACLRSTCMCAVCAMIRMRVCSCVQPCAISCLVLDPQNCFSSFVVIFFSCCCCCRVMSSVSHRASSYQPFYYVAATVQQQSHSKFVWITSMRVLTLHIYACVCDGCVCYDV